MAIYRTGKASMDANGIVTGYGTKWRKSLSLIRVGATIIFIDNPAYATIIDVVSDTELRVSETGGAVVPQSDYVILLHDSLSVDGLAQDVAETLRYYQGKENEFAHLIELIGKMDIEAIQKVVDQMKEEVKKFEENFKKIEAKAEEVERNAQHVDAVKGEVDLIRTQTEDLKNQANSSALQAQSHVNAAAAEVEKAAAEFHKAELEAARAGREAVKAKAEATRAQGVVDAAKVEVVNEARVEVERAKAEADRAKGVVDNAKVDLKAEVQVQVDKATEEANRAKDEADRAAGLAGQLDATNLLNKNNNLSDVSDLSAARQNMKVDRLLQDDNMTRIKSSDARTELRIGYDDWFVYRDSHDSEAGYVALPVKGGGTGGSTPLEAREGLELERFRQHPQRTEMATANGEYRLFVGDEGDWGVLNRQSERVVLPVKAGGTGATTADSARVNLQLDRFAQEPTAQTYMFAQNKKMKIYVDSNGDWGAFDEASGAIKPLPVNRGGTGAVDASGARNNFGLGETQGVTFGQVTSKTNNGVNGGIFESDNYNSNGVLISRGRMYSEIQNGVGKFTVSVSANNKTKYLQYDEDANLSGIGNLMASRVETGSVGCTGSIWAGQGNSIGMSTSAGGDKNIFLQNAGGDGNTGSWVNLLQGNWYDGYWQLGAIRGGGTDISAVRLGVNNQGTDWKWFDFNNSYGGHITALRGFKGQCVAGGWALDSEYMGAPFYADTAINNDGGYSPVVAGGTRASSGYDIRYSFGAISGGTGSWPRTAIHMIGDATHHRIFEFFVDGRIYSWDNAGQWGGNFEFQRVANCDRDLKKDIEYNDGKASYDNIMKFKPSTFVYKSDKYNRVRRGVIAQDLCEIDPEYVRIIPGSPIIDNDAGTDEEGKLFITDYHDDTLGLDNNVIMIDTALATRYIGGIVEKQQEEIDNLKSEIEELKALIKALQ